LVASPDARDASIAVNTDASLYAGTFSAGERAEHVLAPLRHAWVQVARGALRVNGRDVKAGDGVAISDEPSVVIEGTSGGEALLFDLG
jgi:hypothetical protein